MNRIFGLLAHPIVKGSLIYSIAGLLGKSAPLVLLPFMTRVLTPGDYGMVASATAVYFLAVVVGESGSVNHIAKSYYVNPSRRSATRVESAAVSGFGMIILLFSLGAFGGYIMDQTGIPRVWVFWIIVAAFLRVILNQALFVLHFQGRTLTYAGAQLALAMAETILSAFLTTTIEWGWKGRIFAMLGVSAVGGMVALFDVILLWRSFPLALSRVVQNWLSGFAIVVHGTSNWMMTSLDRYLIAILDAPSNAGIYAVAAQLVSILVLLSAAFGQAWNRQLFKELACIDDRMKIQIVRWTWGYAFVWAVCCVAFYFCFPFAVQFFVGEKFRAIDELALLLVGQAFFTGLYFVVSGYYFAKGATKLLAGFTILCGAFSFGANIFLIPRLGATGAAIGGVAASFLYFVLVWWGSMKVQPMPWFSWRGKV